MSSTRKLLPAPKMSLLESLLEGEATVEGLSENSRTHPSVVRRHLEELRLAGLVQKRNEIAGRGRPSIIYSLTAEGRELFFSKYALLLDQILQAAVREHGLEEAKKMMYSAAENLARTTGTYQSAAEAVTFLRENGFQPETRTEGDRRLLVSGNCPVLKTATAHPELVCETFHTVLLEKKLGVEGVRLRETMARGAAKCVHELPARME